MAWLNWKIPLLFSNHQNGCSDAWTIAWILWTTSKEKLKFLFWTLKPMSLIFLLIQVLLSQSNQIRTKFFQSLANAQPRSHVVIDVTKKCFKARNKMTLNSFIMPCRLSFFKGLIKGCSYFHWWKKWLLTTTRLTTLTLPEFPCKNDCHIFALHHRIHPFKIKLI